MNQILITKVDNGYIVSENYLDDFQKISCSQERCSSKKVFESEESLNRYLRKDFKIESIIDTKQH